MIIAGVNVLCRAGDQQESEKKFHKKMPLLLRLCLSLFDALMSRSELVCYFVLILNHLVNASLLSLVYPVSVFLWAMLSVPRPDKTYWVVVITYTEVGLGGCFSSRQKVFVCVCVGMCVCVVWVGGWVCVWVGGWVECVCACVWCV